MKNMVDESTLNFEWYLAPLVFCYNMSYRRAIKTLRLELTYAMRSRLPSFPVQELTRISYTEDFVAKRLQRLRKVRQIAMKESLLTGD
jgi:hypothetical protein